MTVSVSTDAAGEGADVDSLLPEPAERVYLDVCNSVLFLSDLHLGDGSRTDLLAGQDHKLISFIESQRSEVSVVVFLGDILDMPQAWTTARIRSAHPELWRCLRRLAREDHTIFTRGNHDWVVDYEALFPGSTRCQAVLLGSRILAWHGHQVDLLMHPGAKNARVSTYAHALMERSAGCRLVPPLERYDTPANRGAIAITTLAARLGMASARLQRALGRTEPARQIETRIRYLARSFLGDPADLYGASVARLLGDRFDQVICGHSHVPGVVHTPSGVYVNTGSWACRPSTYALWTGEEFQVREVTGGRQLADERYAGLPEHTVPEDLFRWWDAHHRGMLKFEF